MIEEVVNSILEAEDEAKRRIAEAESKAAEIVANAEQEALSFKKNEAANNKKLYAEQMKNADELAEQQASKRLAELNAVADKESGKYAQNVNKAVKIIIEAN